MSDHHPATPTGLTLLERLDMVSWNLTREAAARIRALEAIAAPQVGASYTTDTAATTSAHKYGRVVNVVLAR